LHPFTAISGNRSGSVKNTLRTHMVNIFFKAAIRINRDKLHKCFLNNGFYSRFEPCNNAAVNLRFHYRKDDMGSEGKCSARNKNSCTCKDISVSCFNSGTITVAGLTDMEQGIVVYNFMERFFTENQDAIKAVHQDSSSPKKKSSGSVKYTK